MFAVRHLNQGISQVRLASLLFDEPDFMKTPPADTPAQVRVKLGKEDGHWSANGH